MFGILAAKELETTVNLCCQFDLADILLQTLVLADEPVGTEQPRVNVENIRCLVDERLSVPEMARLPPLEPSHLLWWRDWNVTYSLKRPITQVVIQNQQVGSNAAVNARPD